MCEIIGYDKKNIPIYPYSVVEISATKGLRMKRKTMVGGLAISKTEKGDLCALIFEKHGRMSIIECLPEKARVLYRINPATMKGEGKKEQEKGSE